MQMTSPLLDMLPALVVGTGITIALSVWATLYRVPHPYGARARQMTVPVVGAGLFLAGWYALALLLAVRGAFHGDVHAAVPPVAFGVLLPLAIGYTLALGSSTFRKRLDHVPQHWLIGIQLYRTFGLVFLWLYGKALLPGQFAIPAGYGDLFVGLTAPLVAYAYFKRTAGARPLAIAWNLFGILDLIVAVGMGVLSGPGPLQLFVTDPSTERLTLFPLVLIPVFAVPLSVLLHLFSLRRLLQERHH